MASLLYTMNAKIIHKFKSAQNIKHLQGAIKSSFDPATYRRIMSRFNILVQDFLGDIYDEMSDTVPLIDSVDANVRAYNLRFIQSLRTMTDQYNHETETYSLADEIPTYRGNYNDNPDSLLEKWKRKNYRGITVRDDVQGDMYKEPFYYSTGEERLLPEGATDSACYTKFERSRPLFPSRYPNGAHAGHEVGSAAAQWYVRDEGIKHAPQMRAAAGGGFKQAELAPYNAALRADRLEGWSQNESGWRGSGRVQEAGPRAGAFVPSFRPADSLRREPPARIASSNISQRPIEGFSLGRAAQGQYVQGLPPLDAGRAARGNRLCGATDTPQDSVVIANTDDMGYNQHVSAFYTDTMNRLNQEETIPFGVGDPREDERLLNTRIMRSAWADEEGGIPNYRKRLHRRYQDNDIDEALSATEYTNVGFGKYDMRSLRARLEQNKRFIDSQVKYKKN